MERSVLLKIALACFVLTFLQLRGGAACSTNPCEPGGEYDHWFTGPIFTPNPTTVQPQGDCMITVLTNASHRQLDTNVGRPSTLDWPAKRLCLSMRWVCQDIYHAIALIQECLGLTSSKPDLEETNKAYKKWALILHPDKNSRRKAIAHKLFAALQEACELLGLKSK